MTREAERKRLVELIKQGDKAFTDKYTGKIMMLVDKIEEVYDFIADHLLDNGIVVPPCKVGDVIYYNKAEINETCPAKVIGIYNNFYTPSMPLWITIEYQSKLIGRQEEKMTSDVFKLLCFTAREEAEKALRKEDEGK